MLVLLLPRASTHDVAMNQSCVGHQGAHDDVYLEYGLVAGGYVVPEITATLDSRWQVDDDPENESESGILELFGEDRRMEGQLRIIPKSLVDPEPTCDAANHGGLVVRICPGR